MLNVNLSGPDIAELTGSLLSVNINFSKFLKLLAAIGASGSIGASNIQTEFKLEIFPGESILRFTFG